MTAIEINNLTKTYCLYNSPRDRLRELISLNGRKYHHEFHALNDVSFTIEKGETVGIIGQNGSGKSTLLKIICGVVKPTGGSVKVNGRISSLLELGAGFHPDFTGRENVYMNGALMGFTREEMELRFPEIEAFADIGEFIDQPVKVYSSGMYVRLAFAVAINVDPDILIIDEALSVGDMFFRAKCTAKMKQMIDKGITLLFVTHDIVTVKSICRRCVLLSHGNMVEYGPSDKVVEKYFAMKVEREQKVLVQQGDQDRNLTFSNNSEFQKRAAFQRLQNGKANFVNIQLLNDRGEEITVVDYEQEVTLRMAIEVLEDIPELAFGYNIRDKNGVDIVYSDSVIESKNLYSLTKGEVYIVDWKYKSSLKHGNYNIACVLSIPIDSSSGRVDFCDYVPLAVQFNMAMRKGAVLYGSVHLENSVEVINVTPGVDDADVAHRLR